VNGPDFYHSERMSHMRRNYSLRECVFIAALMLVTLFAVSIGAFQ